MECQVPHFVSMERKKRSHHFQLDYENRKCCDDDLKMKCPSFTCLSKKVGQKIARLQPQVETSQSNYYLDDLTGCTSVPVPILDPTRISCRRGVFSLEEDIHFSIVNFLKFILQMQQVVN